MSADLTDDEGNVHQVRSSVWSFVLLLAEEYGWRPQGTQPPPGVGAAHWDGGYGTMDGQRVLAEDASQFAAALDRARADPERGRVEHRVSDTLNRSVRELALREYGIDLPSDDEEQEGVSDEFLDALSAFARRGTFRVF